jgi:chromosome segregation ATPase
MRTRQFFWLCVAALYLSLAQQASAQQGEGGESGKTQPLSTTKSASLKSSEAHLNDWETLSWKFDQTLSAHEATLTELSAKLATSENNGRLLTSLLGELSRQNADLKTFNTQIAERMQDRDQELAALYDEVSALEKDNRRLILLCILAGGLLVIHIALKVCFIK